LTSTLDLGNLLVHFKADLSQYKRSLKEAKRQLRATSDQLTQIGRQMTLAFTVPITGGAIAGVKAFASFDDAMTKSLSIMKGVTPEMRREMEDLASTMSMQTKTSATDLAQSYYFLASAGMDAERSMKALGAVERFATAGAFDMALATDLLTDAQSALGYSSKNATQNLVGMTAVSDAVVGSANIANASIQQFAEALTSDAAASMRALQIPLEEGMATLAVYADQGKKGAEGGNLFGRALRLMTSSLNDNRAAWERYNIQVYDAHGVLLPMGEIVTNLSRAFAGLSPEEKTARLELLGFAALAQKSIVPLIGMGDTIKEYTKRIKEAGGETKAVAKFQLTSFTSQIKILWNWVTVAARQIGKVLAPALLQLSSSLQQGLLYWFSINEEVRKNIVYIGLAAAAIGPLTMGVGLLGKSLLFSIATVKGLSVAFLGLFGAVAAPLAGILAITAVAYTLRASWNENLLGIEEATKNLYKFLSAGFAWLSENVIAKFVNFMYDSFVEGLKVVYTFVTETFSAIAGEVGGWVAYWKTIFTEGIDAASKAEERARKKWKRGAEDFFEGLPEKAVDGYKAVVDGIELMSMATVAQAKDMLAAVKKQFGKDFSGIVKLIEENILKIKDVSGDTLLQEILSPEDFQNFQAMIKKAGEELREVNRYLVDMQEPMQKWAEDAADTAGKVGEV